MRDTARARVERARTAVTTENRRAARALERAALFARVATEPVPAPKHGAEYARSLLWFTEQLGDKASTEALAKSFDDVGVIWRPSDQVAAARKQITRLRSDAVASGCPIPITTLVYATDTHDFVGSTYVRVCDATLPVKDSTGPVIVLRQGRSRLPVDVTALRYVEGPMIRAR